MRTAAAFLLLTFVATFTFAQQNSGDWSSVEKAFGRSGKPQPGNVYKFSMPRSDMQVSVAGTSIKAGLALGSWAAFAKHGSESVVMGDLVLADDEVEPVMLKLEQGGIEITALHNHLLHETPRVMYMHIHGHGDATKLATTLHDALALTKTPPAAPPPAKSEAPAMDTAQIESVLGRKGTDANGILQFSIPRAETITDNGMTVPPSMGVATGINFQPTEGGKAAITGDFVLVAKEVNPVIRALRENGIEVEALHSHMLTESPRLFFMHFWGNDDAVKLAKGLRAALDATNSAAAK